jgi:hypothetical protein
VDKDTFFVLKVVQFGGTDAKVLSTTEVTSVNYNVPIDPAQFTFTPPADAQVGDFRPKPTPSPDQFQQQLVRVAGQVDFPLFVPREIPAGLTPTQPRLDGLTRRVQLGYIPGGEDTTAAAGPPPLTIGQEKATYEAVQRSAEQAEPFAISGGQGWLRPGVPSGKGTGGSDSVAIVLRTGTLISVASSSVPDELVKVASSFEPVQGGHAPLPNPTPPALATLRSRVAFAVFMPTWVPAGLTPEPPLGGEQATQNVEVRYHTVDGRVGLTVGNGQIGCCPGLTERLQGASVTLPNGLEAKIIRTPTDRYGGPTLWWEQGGTTIWLRGPAVSESELVKIAASMSGTADLGPAGSPPDTPTTSS